MKLCYIHDVLFDDFFFVENQGFEGRYTIRKEKVDSTRHFFIRHSMKPVLESRNQKKCFNKKKSPNVRFFLTCSNI
jgi:hypothetical protein